MIFIGLDVSLTGTGLAVMNSACDEEPFTTTIKTDAKSPTIQRIRHVAQTISNARYTPEAVIIEGPSLASRFGKPHERAGLWWALYDIFYDVAPIHIASPKSVKLFVAGRGDAKKPDMIRGIKRIYQNFSGDDNQADAAGLLLMAMVHHGEAAPDLDETHLKALGRVKWA